MTRNIGIKVNAPKEEPKEGDTKNPFNGTLPIRGKLFEGKVIKSKAKDTVVIQKESPVYFTKFKRYARSCLLYTSPSPRDKRQSRMPSSA